MNDPGATGVADGWMFVLVRRALWVLLGAGLCVLVAWWLWPVHTSETPEQRALLLTLHSDLSLYQRSSSSIAHTRGLLVNAKGAQAVSLARELDKEKKSCALASGDYGVAAHKVARGFLMVRSLPLNLEDAACM